MSKTKRYRWGEFCAKQDYEGTEYMMTQLEPKAVPKELEAAQAALQQAYNAWDAIIQEHCVDWSEDDDT